MSCTDSIQDKKTEEVVKKDSTKSASVKAAEEDLANEVEIGRGMAGRLLQFYGTYDDEDLAQYVNQVGRHVAKFANDPKHSFHFEVLNTPMINAFACPGGYILITMGALATMNDEAELAAALGHELAHVTKQHLYHVLKSANVKKTVSEGDKTDGPKWARKRPDPEDESAAGGMIARYLSGSTGAGISFLAAAKEGMNIILEKGLDKKYELEADIEGVRYATEAGYDPKGLLKFLERLDKQRRSSHMEMLSKTHPSPQDRRKNITVSMRSYDGDSIVGAAGKERFMEKTAKVRQTYSEQKNNSSSQEEKKP
jgi:predicted Zn-dependent protease